MEKQSIQQQEHVQEHVKQEQVQIQSQSQQILLTKTKTKKRRKHTQLETQELVIDDSISDQYEHSATLAHETSTGSPQAETLDQIDEHLPTYETLTLQNLPKDTVETIAVTVTTELSTPKAFPAQVQDEMLPQKVLPIREECLVLDEVALHKEIPTVQESKLREQVEVRPKHAVDIVETEVTEAPKELKPSRIPKSVKAQQKLKETRPLLVEAPITEEKTEEVQPFKPDAHRAHGDIEMFQELTKEQQSSLDTFEQLRSSQAIEETARSTMLHQEGVIITEAVIDDTIVTEIRQEKPQSEKISPSIMANTEVSISEYHPEDSLGELRLPSLVRTESSTTSVIEHKAVNTCASEPLDTVDFLPTDSRPIKYKAEVTLKPEDIPIVMQEIEPFESVSDRKLFEERIAKTKATQQLVLVEGVINTTADSQSPTDENIPIFDKDIREAKPDFQTQFHVTTYETVPTEGALKDLADITAPKMVEGTVSQPSTLTIGETEETNLAESAKAFTEPVVELAKPAKRALTQAYGTAESAQEPQFDALGIVADEDRKAEHGRIKIIDGEIVAQIQTPLVIESEQDMSSDTPKFEDAKINFVEQAALNIEQLTMAENESVMQTAVPQAPQLAEGKMVPGELKASSVLEVQTGISSGEVLAQATKPASAVRAFETLPIGVSSRPGVMESSGLLEPCLQPEHKTGTVTLDEKQISLEVTNVQITESSTELPENLPQKLLSEPQLVPDTLKHATGLEVISMESTSDNKQESKPSMSLAQVSLSANYGTKVSQPSVLESVEDHHRDLQPQLQTSDTHFGLLQPLETTTCVTLESDTTFSPEDSHSLQNAFIGTSRPLQVADTTIAEHLEVIEQLAEQKPQHLQAYLGMNEINLPHVAEDVPLDAVQDYTSSEVAKPSVSNMQIVEVISTLNTSTTIVSEGTTELPNKDLPVQILASSKLNEFLPKPSVTEQAVLENAAGLNTELAKPAVVQQTFSSFNEINVCETEALEKEDLLEGVAHPTEQLISVVMDTTSAVALVRNEDSLELEQNLQISMPKSEQAKTTTSELPKLPIVEDIQEVQSAGDMVDFKVFDKYASPQIDILNEIKSSEVIVYDSVSKDIEVSHLDKVAAQKSLVSQKHVTVSENVVIDDTKLLQDFQTDQRTAQRVQDNLSHSILAQDLSILESESSLNAETTQAQTAKLGEDIPRFQANLVEEAVSYEAMGKQKPSEKYNEQSAVITHELAQVQATEIQQVVDSEINLITPEQSFALASSNAEPSLLGLPVTMKTMTEEKVDDLYCKKPSEITAEVNYENKKHQVNVWDVQSIEESEDLAKPDMETSTAAESIDVMFKAISESDQPQVFLKESTVPILAPVEVKAKSVTNLLQETTISDVFALESSEHIEDFQVSVKEAQMKLFTDEASNKVNVRTKNVLLHKEEILENTLKERFGKPLIEGSQQEMLVTEIVPFEDVDIPLIPEGPNKLQATSTTSDTTYQSHVVETQIALELEGKTTDVIESIFQAKVKSDHVNIHKTILEVNTYEKTKDMKDAKNQDAFGKISKDVEVGKAHVTTIQSSFLKEDILPQFDARNDKAQVSSEELKALVTEEVVGLSSIQETYELKVPPEHKATVIPQRPREATEVSEQTTFEEIPDIGAQPTDTLQTIPTPVEILYSPLKSSIVNVYENIEGHGNFKPDSAIPSFDEAIPSELNVSVVEEVIAMPTLGLLSAKHNEELIAMPESILHRNIICSEQLSYEAEIPLLENKAPSTEKAIQAPVNQRFAPVINEEHEKGTIQELTDFQVEETRVLSSITTQSTYLSEQTLAHEEVNLLENQEQKDNKKAKISFSTNTIATTEQLDTFNTEGSEVKPHKPENIPSVFVHEGLRNVIQTTHFVSESTHDIPPQTESSHFVEEIKTEPLVRADDTDRHPIQEKVKIESSTKQKLKKTVTPKIGKYYIEYNFRSKQKGVLLYFHWTPKPQKHILHRTKIFHKIYTKHDTKIHFFTQIQNKPQTHHTLNQRHKL